MAATGTTWLKFHAAFQATFMGYIKRGLFVGEDQAILQSTCMQHPDLCITATPGMVQGSPWFGLQNALHYGFNYKLLARDYSRLWQ